MTSYVGHLATIEHLQSYNLCVQCALISRPSLNLDIWLVSH